MSPACKKTIARLKAQLERWRKEMKRCIKIIVWENQIKAIDKLRKLIEEK